VAPKNPKKTGKTVLEKRRLKKARRAEQQQVVRKQQRMRAA
jgi:hypothetical protein